MYKNGGVPTMRGFRGLENKGKFFTKRLKGTTLSDVEFMHLISKKKVYKITIGADELQEYNNETFIKNLWQAEQVFYSEFSISVTPTLTDFVEVVIDEGAIPIDWFEGHVYLPFITLELKEKFRI